MLGTRAFVAADIDRDGLVQRSKSRVPALVDRLLLRELTVLPYLEPVPKADLTLRSLEILSRAPKGVVSLDRDHVTRTVRPAVTLRGAAVVHDDWRVGLDAVSPFAAFCPRVLVLPRFTAERDWAEIEAAIYGIGVAIRVGGSITLSVRPERRAFTSGPASWRICELALVAMGLAAHSQAVFSL
jgi:hypothetical protein